MHFFSGYFTQSGHFKACPATSKSLRPFPKPSPPQVSFQAIGATPVRHGRTLGHNPPASAYHTSRSTVSSHLHAWRQLIYLQR